MTAVVSGATGTNEPLARAPVPDGDAAPVFMGDTKDSVVVYEVSVVVAASSEEVLFEDNLVDSGLTPELKLGDTVPDECVTPGPGGTPVNEGDALVPVGAITVQPF